MSITAAGNTPNFNGVGYSFSANSSQLLTASDIAAFANTIYNSVDNTNGLSYIIAPIEFHWLHASAPNINYLYSGMHPSEVQATSVSTITGTISQFISGAVATNPQYLYSGFSIAFYTTSGLQGWSNTGISSTGVNINSL